MHTIETSQLKEGMITASPVMTNHGKTVVGEHVRLTNALIAHIAFYEIPHAEILDPEDMPDEFSKPHAPKQPYSERVIQSAGFQELRNLFAKAVEDLKNIIPLTASGTKTPDIAELCGILQPFQEKASTSIELFDFLHNMRTINDSIYAHSTNVALISTMLGKWLNLPDDKLQMLTAAALLHDIGKIKIPAEFLDKPGEYTDEEFAHVKRHPEFGYELLSRFHNLDAHILNAALMHHERCDGSGYPHGLKANEIDEFAQIIAIADVYDAMTAARVYRNPICPFRVIEDFEIEGLQKYNPRFILTFLERIAFTYQNNRVLLTDGRHADIIMLNKQFLSRPTVEADDGTCIELFKTPNLRIQSLL